MDRTLMAWEAVAQLHHHGPNRGIYLIELPEYVYGECIARLISTTVRLEEEDVQVLKRARAAGHSASELIRKGLRVVASRY